MTSIDPQEILRTLRRELESLYRERFRGLYLFGSHARGDAGPESDVDVLVVLDRVERYGEEVRRTGGIFSSLSLEWEVSIVPVFTSEPKWRDASSAFLANVRREAPAA
jgi:predicted nucleotidyltransferase